MPRVLSPSPPLYSCAWLTHLCDPRFLCKINSAEILGPLMESIKANLTHRHHYVRKNAALCAFHVHKTHGDALLPDGPELMREFLENETDTSARRNAFLMCINQAEEVAIQFLAKTNEDVLQYGEGFALLVLELTRKVGAAHARGVTLCSPFVRVFVCPMCLAPFANTCVQVCRRDPNEKGRFVRVLFQMLASTDAGVSYEAAWTLCSLSTSPTAIRAAVSAYATLLNGSSDSSIQLIVLERLEDLKGKYGKVMQEVLMDVMRALSSPSVEICRKVLDVTMDLVTQRNVEEVVTLLKREVAKTQENDMEKGKEYRTMLIQSIHSCASKYPEVAGDIVGQLMDLLGGDGALDVVIFVRAIVEQYPELRPEILSCLVDNLEGITQANVMTIVLWILSEYGTGEAGYESIMTNLGSAPYVEDKKDEEKKVDEGPKMVTKNVVLADGTYATQTVYSEAVIDTASTLPSLRKMIVEGDIFLGSVLASSLTKICLKNRTNKRMTVDTLLALCGIAKMSSASVSSQKSAAADCHARLTLCIRVLLDPQTNSLLSDSFITSGRVTFAELLRVIKEKELANVATKAKVSNVAPDDLIHIRQLKMSQAAGGDIDLDDGSDLLRACASVGDSGSGSWKHVYQLTGFADPIYAEAMLQVNDYDIKLEILCINRTPEALVTSIELNTMGDMKLVERPQTKVIGPLDQVIIKASIKVSSTESGHLFGTIVHESADTGAKGYINLNDIHMDIMDYIRPASCTDESFRSMWAEFEWENKVAISTSITSLPEFLEHIVENTNMTCLTPYDKTNTGLFLACNLHARSVFGEDALVNVSVEKKQGGKLSGYIRIRSKTQGIALSLGDRITTVQRRHDEEEESKAAAVGAESSPQ